MNTNPHSPPPSAEEQAALWAAKLDGSVLSAEERIALDAWLELDPQHRELLSSYCQLSSDLELLMPALGLPPEPAEPHPAPAVTKRRLLWFAGPLLAAAAAIALLFWSSGAPSRQQGDVATSIAKRQALTLADGSTAELNARTALKIQINAEERRVRLAGGQAFFRVQHGDPRPFVVETPAGTVRVTGTQFETRSDHDRSLAVLVLAGSVQVYLPDAAADEPRNYTLQAGNRLKLNAGQVDVDFLSDAAVLNELAWRDGFVVCNATPLAEALAHFARYHGKGITAAAEVAGLHLGGRFSLDDLDGFLSAVEAVLPVSVTRDISGTIRVNSRPTR